MADRVLRRRLTELSTEQVAIIADLRKKMTSLAPLETSGNSEAAESWRSNRIKLRELVARHDPRGFLDWDVINDTMFVGNFSYIPTELAALRNSPQWHRRWRFAIREDASGRPKRCRWHLRSSGNLIHHAYGLHEFERVAGRAIESFDQIIEFGGGYGSLCRLAYNLGFVGDYVIIDFPEFCALQEYFLHSVALEKKCDRQARVSYITDLADLRNLRFSRNSLFIALWSLSETPLPVRRQALESLDAVPNAYVAYQSKFGEVDNGVFFHDWRARRQEMKWTHIAIPHLPGNSFLIGQTLS